MAHVELDGDRISIHSDFREKELCKAVPGARWDDEARVWRLPLSWASCVALRGIFGDLLTIGPELNEWARQEQVERVLPALELRTRQDAPGDERLYAFQRVGVNFMTVAGSMLLADEMGLGKTPQTIATLTSLAAWPVLIVCPNSMKHVWYVELSRWAPEVDVHLVDGGKSSRVKAISTARAAVEEGSPVAVVINWEALRLHTRLAGYGSIRLSEDERTERELNQVPWRAVVADEAHRGKDPTTKQTRALWGVSRAAEHRFALTGTPIANNPQDLWSLMHFVAPHEWPSKVAFIARYCVQSWGWGGSMEITGIKSETRDELFKVLDPRFLRRPKAAVLHQLPAKTYVKRWVDLAVKQRRAYDQLRKDMLAELDGGVLLATRPLQRFVRLVQFASAHGEMVGDKLVLTEPSCKVDALEEVAEELGHRPAVVFAESRQLIELAAARLTKLGYQVGLITGSVSLADRQQTVERFQANELQFICATMGAGGEGLTLTAADTAIFLQRSFSSVRNSQAEDRIHRIGQEASAVTIIDLIAKDTVEERVHEIMVEKAERLEEVVRDEETVRTWLSK